MVDTNTQTPPAKTETPAATQTQEQTPDQLHDAAIAATEAWQNETDETKRGELKTKAQEAVKTAKESLKTYTTKLTEAAKPKAPEKYEIKLPKDSPLSAGDVDEISAIAKQKGLSNEGAQLLLDERNATAIKIQTQAQTQVQEQKTKWATEVQADKEIGGEAFKQNAELAKRFVKKFGDPEFGKMLDESGYGNHPGLVRMIVRAAKLMSPDQLVIPGSQEGAKVAKTAEEAFYGAPSETTKT